MSNDFSERLISLRGDRKKADFARELGIPAPMYHRYENGQVPQYDNLKVISAKTGKPVEWLLTGRDDFTYEVVRSDMQIQLHVARKCLGKTFKDIATLMGVERTEVEDVAAGKAQPTTVFSDAYEKQIVPLVEEFEKTLYQRLDLATLHKENAKILECISSMATDLSLIKKLLDKL